MSFAPKQFIRSVDFLSTENAINTSTGCVNIYGGMSVSKDSYLTNMIVVGNSTVTNLHITGSLITSTGNTLTSSQWRSIDSNTDIYFGTSANAFVGIGTTTPSFNLDISGGSRITGGLTVGNLNVNTGATITNLLSTTICTGTIIITAGSLNAGFNANTIGNIFTTSGNVGIGTTSPGTRLDVTGTARVSTSLTSGALYSTNITSTNIVGTNITGSNLNISGTLNSGDVTVGNINFTGSLYQNGSAYLGSQWTTTSGNTLTYTSGNVSINNAFTSSFNSNTLGNIFTTGGNVGINTALPTTTLDVNGNYSLGGASNKLYSDIISLSIENASDKVHFVVAGIGMAFILKVFAARSSATQESADGEEFFVNWSGNTAQTPIITRYRSFSSTNSGTRTAINTWYYDSTTKTLTLQTARGSTISQTFGYLIQGRISAYTLSIQTTTPAGTILNYTGLNQVNDLVGVGMIPVEKLDVSGTLRITSGGLLATFNSNTVGSLFTTGGNVGIGTSSPTFTLDVTGSGDFSTFVTTGSLCSTNQTTTNIVSTNLSTGTLNATTVSSTIVSATTITGANLSLSGNLNVAGTLTVVNVTTTNLTMSNGNALLNLVTSGTILTTNLIGTNITTNNFIVTGGNTRIFSTTTTNNILLGNGPSASSFSTLSLNPGYIFNGTTFTTNANSMSFDLPGTGTISFSDNIILNGGSLGIGTTSPGNNLDVSGTARITTSLTTGSLFSTNQTTTNIVVTNLSTGTLNASTMSTVILTASTGITTGSIRIDGAVHAFSNDTLNTMFVENNGGGGGTQGSLRVKMNAASGVRNILQLENGTGTVMIVRDDSRVGVNTTSPTYTLDVAGTTRITNTTATSMGTLIVAGPGSVNYTPSTATSGQLASFYGPGGTSIFSNVDFSTYTPATSALPSVRFSMKDLGAANSDFNILTRNVTGTMASRIFIDGSGNIGISTTNPQTKLHIEDGSVFIGDISAGFSTSVPSAAGAPITSANSHRLFFDNSYNGTAGTGVPANKILIHNNNWTGGFGMEFGAVTYHSGELHRFYCGATNSSSYGSLALSIGSTQTLATTNTNGEGSIRIVNSNSGSTAYSTIRIGNNTGDSVIFLNSSTRTIDGGGNTCTFRNDVGALRLQGSGATNTIYLPGSSTNVGINTTAPRSNLEITQTSTTTGLMLFSGNDTGVNRIIFNHSDTSSSYQKIAIESQALGANQFGRSNFSIRVNTAGDITNVGSGDTRFFIHGTSGNVGIMTTSPSYPLHVAGDIYATGDVISFSDSRLKTDVETITGALDKVSNMRGVYYTNLNTQTRETGVIAQEISEILPEVVADKGEYLGVAYGNIVGVLIEAIKELKARVVELESKTNP